MDSLLPKHGCARSESREERACIESVAVTRGLTKSKKTQKRARVTDY
jgi:hypothetical protein